MITSKKYNNFSVSSIYSKHLNKITNFDFNIVEEFAKSIKDSYKSLFSDLKYYEVINKFTKIDIKDFTDDDLMIGSEVFEDFGFTNYSIKEHNLDFSIEFEPTFYTVNNITTIVDFRFNIILNPSTKLTKILIVVPNPYEKTIEDISKLAHDKLIIEASRPKYNKERTLLVVNEKNSKKFDFIDTDIEYYKTVLKTLENMKKKLTN